MAEAVLPVWAVATMYRLNAVFVLNSGLVHLHFPTCFGCFFFSFRLISIDKLIISTVSVIDICRFILRRIYLRLGLTTMRNYTSETIAEANITRIRYLERKRNALEIPGRSARGLRVAT